MLMHPFKPGDMLRTSGAIRWNRRLWSSKGCFLDYSEPLLVIETQGLSVFVLSACGKTGWSITEQFVLVNSLGSE